MSEIGFMASGASNPAQRLELVGVTYAARCLGITPEGLRFRIKNGTGTLKPIGMLAEPDRLLFRKIDVIAAVEAEKDLNAQE